MVGPYQKNMCHADYGVIATVLHPLCITAHFLQEEQQHHVQSIPYRQYQPFSDLGCAVATLSSAFGT